LALGVLIVSLRGSSVDLLHVLFGSILAIDASALILVGAIASITVVTLAIIYRPLVAECFDPGFLRAVSGRGPSYHLLFLLLVVLNLVAGFQALGTLMAVGLMMLPAAVAQLWVRGMPALIGVSIATACVSGYAGLVISFHSGLASGPTIILVAGGLYLSSLLFAPSGALRRLLPRRHFAKRTGR
jgi:zinc/manganese transport system permease protein